MGDPVPAKVRYSRLKTLFKKRLSLARDLLGSRIAVYEQIKDTREELKSSMRELEVCSVMCDEADCTDLDQLQTDSQRVVADMALRMETLRTEKEREGKARLTEIKTPKFSGDVCEYISFKAKFTDLVVARTTDKIALLKLRDEALREGSSEHLTTLGAKTVTEAFQYLDRQFADVETQRNAFIVKLKRFPAIADWYDSVALRKLVGMLRSTRAAFSMLNCDSLDSATFSALMSKLPETLRREIDAKVFDQKCQTIDGRFQIFLELCERQAAMSETHTYRTEAYATSMPARSFSAEHKFLPETSLVAQGKSPNTSQNQGFSGADAPTCLFHPNSRRHKTSVCNQLLVLPTVQVLDTLRRNGHCFRCFEKHDLQRKCGVTCPEANCPRPHSHGKLLHSAFVLKSSASSAGTVNTVSFDQENPFALLCDSASHSLVADTQSGGQSVATESAVLEPVVISDFDGYASDSSNTAVTGSSLKISVTNSSVAEHSQELGLCSLRPCQVAFMLGADGRPFPVNVLYDMASDLSQITARVAQGTSMKPYAVLDHLYLHVAGDQAARSFGKSSLFAVPIYDSSGTKMFDIRCWSVPYIGKLRAVDIDDSVLRFKSHGFDCSDILRPPSGSIDILIGCNYSEYHPLPVSTIDGVTLARVGKGSVMYGAHSSFTNGASCPAKLVSTQMQTLAVLDVHDDSLPDTLAASSCHATAVASTRFDRADDLYDKIARIEELPCANCGHPKSETKHDQRQIAIYREGLRYCPEDRKVTTRLPWSDKLWKVPDNKAAAVKRLKALTKSLAKNPKLRDDYRREVQKMIDAGILVEISPEEQKAWIESGCKVWYACHFPVENDNSLSTPVRVVFDFSKSFKGVNLSKLWEVPPNLIPDIFGMWVRFRDLPVAMCLDFSKAYWTVWLEEQDSHMQRVLWNDLDETAPLRTFRMTRNSFGMVPSGAICTLAMFLVAEHHQAEYPEVYDFIRRNVYVDDGVTSLQTLPQAVDLAKDVSHVMSNGGFNLKHIHFGGQGISQEHMTKCQDALPHKASLLQVPTKVLGGTWNPTSDTLSLNGAKRGDGSVETAPLTLRNYVSAMASLFDPLGLATPTSILLKHELGRLFLLGLAWDDPIPPAQGKEDVPTQEKCRLLLRMLDDVSSISFPRCVVPRDAIDQQPLLVGFCDASQAAYAACAYFNWQCSDGARRSVLATAKGKPMSKKGKLMTIPRAELQSCLLLARLVVSLLRSSQHQPSRILFLSDSTIALRQISASPLKLKVWPAVRVEEVQEIVPEAEWMHVSSSNNIADLGIRGAVPRDIGPESQWQQGSVFLTQDPIHWPVMKVEDMASAQVSDTLLEVRPTVQMSLPAFVPAVQLCANTQSATTTEGLLNDPKFQSALVKAVYRLDLPPANIGRSWLKLRRIGARVVRFLLLLYTRRSRADRDDLKRQRSLVPKGFSQLPLRERRAWLDENDKFAPHVREMEVAAAAFVYKAQSSLNAKRIASMSRGLSPTQDYLGLWHAVGRVYRPEAAPLIIPSDAKLAIVLLRWYHSKLHVGADATLAIVRGRFWIVRGQVLANRVVSKCVRCRKVKRKPVLLDMAPLDIFRVQPAAVFSTVYIDLCGPYLCKAARRDTRRNPALAGKVWVMVVVCAASHAVHLELVENYGTSGFLSAFDVFCNFRSRPVRVIADKGSQITAAGNTLSSLWEVVDMDEVQNHTCDSTEWVFVPSGAHAFVGMAESLVKAVKTAFEVTACSREPCLEPLQFSRLLYSVANLVNDRPLSVGRVRVSALNEQRLIRPNDLLFGRSSGDLNMVADMDFDDLPAKRKQFFDILACRRKMLDQFWTKWYSVVFHTLVSKYKWLKSGRQLEPGDIVIIRDTNPVRGVWTLGQVQNVFVSEKDGKVREALVRYKQHLSVKRNKDDSDASGSKTVQKSCRDLCLILESEKVQE